MPKLKTHRGAAKRFKKTAKGKFLKKNAFRSHILTSKNRKRKRKLRKASTINKTEIKAVKHMLPY